MDQTTLFYFYSVLNIYEGRDMELLLIADE